MKAIILAAGYGTRLYPLTTDRPKTLLEIKGKPLINYIIKKIPKNIDEIFIVTNDTFYMNFVWWLNKQDENVKRRVEIINDGATTSKTKLGGIGDLNLVIQEKNISDDILVILSDNFFTFLLDDFVDFFNKVKKTTIGIFEIKDKKRIKKYGIVEINEGRVTSFEEKPEKPKTNLVSIGVYIFSKEDIEKIKEYMETDLSKEGPGYLVKYFIERGEVYAYKFEGEWFDIGNLEEYEKLNER